MQKRLVNPKSKIQNPKSKIQNPKSKIQNPKFMQNGQDLLETHTLGFDFGRQKCRK